MIEISNTLLLSSSLILGIFLGAKIAEAFLLVPIWTKMKPDDFFEQHETEDLIVDSLGPYELK